MIHCCKAVTTKQIEKKPSNTINSIVAVIKDISSKSARYSILYSYYNIKCTVIMTMYSLIAINKIYLMNLKDIP